MKSFCFFILFLITIKSFSQEKDLRFYIEKAQKNSPLLVDLSNQIKSNILDSLINRANYKPQISGNLNANYAPTLNGYGYDTAV
jgi:outer membrane protein TolC